MNIYQYLFTNVSYAQSIEEKRVYIDHFVAELTVKGPHCELVIGNEQCKLIIAIVRKFGLKHEVTNLSSIRGPFTAMIIELK